MDPFGVLVDQSPIAIEIYEPDGRLAVVNLAWQKFWNLSEDAAADFNIHNDPECKKSGLTAAFEEVIVGKTVELREIWYDAEQSIIQEGARRCINAKVYPIRDRNGAICNVVLTYTDITRQKMDEEKLHYLSSITQQVTESIITTDPEFNINFANKAAQELFGYSEEEMIGKKPDMLNAEPHSEDLQQDMYRKLASGGTFTAQWENKRKDGSVFLCAFSISTLRDMRGRVSGYAGLQRDITENRKLEDQLRQFEKMQAVGQLAGGVAHDFNNQLAAIINYAELAKANLDPHSDAAVFVDHIISGALSSAELTKQLLAFARKGKYEVTHVDIHVIIREVISMLAHSIDKNIRIEHHLNAAPSTVSGDVCQLQNAILNIALNSRDSMPGGGKLTFSTDLVTLDNKDMEDKFAALEPGAYLRVRIQDTGVGMAEEILPHIFEPFFTTKEEGKGTGMGLASAYGTVSNHNGVLDVESKVARGTTMTLYLPPATAELVPVASTSVKLVGAKGRILVVDDEEMVAQSLEALLRQQGYEALTSGSGEDALEIFKAAHHSIDLVLLDMIMPKMSGEETFHALRSINPEVKVLLLSGYSITEGAEDVLNEGIVGFLQKPTMPKDLFEKIASLLDP